MRGHVAGLASPYPYGAFLPALYQEDEFAQRFVAALDEVIAPAIASLDDLDAYLDPQLAPDDFLEWLSEWVGVALDETWPMERRRALVASAAELYRLRGTVAGLAAHVAIFTGGDVDVQENGGTVYSLTPGGTMPGSKALNLHVRVAVDDPSSASVDRLNDLVAAAKPAHVPHSVEIVARKASRS